MKSRVFSSFFNFFRIDLPFNIEQSRLKQPREVDVILFCPDPERLTQPKINGYFQVFLAQIINTLYNVCRRIGVSGFAMLDIARPFFFGKVWYLTNSDHN